MNKPRPKPPALQAAASPSSAGLPFLALGLPAVLVYGLVLWRLIGPDALTRALLTLAVDGSISVVIFVAAAGWGWLALRRLIPAEATGGLWVVTCTAFGLWLLATAVLAAGSAWEGVLSGVVWWPVVGAGCALALFAVRREIERVRLPRRCGFEQVVWLPLAAVAALWAAGALMPQGLIGRATGDFHDVVAYHLQVPREFYEFQQVTFLQHNTYSNYPLGAEMLFLLAMCLRGGPYEGAYAAALTHGLWAILAVATVYCGLPATPWRRRTAAILLATVPLGVYLSWLAFVEWTELASLALAIVWLRWWYEKPGWNSAFLVGIACGLGCATKYLSVGFVAGPVLAVMLGMLASRPRRWLDWLTAATVCLVLMSPWLIRNTATTGNPVFPLATGWLGRGHWSDEEARRWDAAHAPAPWDQKLPQLGRALWGDGPFFSPPAGTAVNQTDRQYGQELGLGLVALAAAGAVWTLIRRVQADSLDFICLAILLLDLAVFVLATHMPARFLVPAAVPMAMLAGGLVARLAGERAKPQQSGSRTLAAALILMLVAAANVRSTWLAYCQEPFAFLHDGRQRGRPSDVHGLLASDLIEFMPRWKAIQQTLEGDTRALLVTDMQPFFYPSNTVYYSIWEKNPLVSAVRETRDPRGIIRRLRQQGITHLWVSWSEVERIRSSFGWWSEVDRPLFDGLLRAGATEVDLPALSPGLQGQEQFVALPPTPAERQGEAGPNGSG